MIYAESQGDFYPRAWSDIGYQNQLNVLNDLTETYLSATDHGFRRIGLIGRIIEFVKGIFGGVDRASEPRVQAAFMQFMYYGEAHQFLKVDDLKKMSRTFSRSLSLKTPAIEFFRFIEDYHVYGQGLSREVHLEQLRKKITDYYQQHAPLLQPGLWTRLARHPVLNPKKLFHFGDTPLQLSVEALEMDKPDPALALRFLKKAFDIKNNEHDFQVKLASQLEALDNGYLSELKGQSGEIQDLWIELAEIAFEQKDTGTASSYLKKALAVGNTNQKRRLQIGRLFLEHGDYACALPFLEDLKKVYSHHPKILSSIGDAYWDLEKYSEAVSAFHQCLNCIQGSRSWKPDQFVQEAHSCNRIGVAALDGLLQDEEADLDKAVKFLAQAVAIDQSVPDYQEDLLEAFEETWKSDPDEFTGSTLSTCLQSLQYFDAAVLSSWETRLCPILIDSSERLFIGHKNTEAHACFDKAFTYFPRNVDLKIEALDLAARFHDVGPLKSRLSEWEQKDYANPYLKMKIGDALWISSQKLAITAYEEAIRLFDKRANTTQDAQEKQKCLKHIAEIRFKIGQGHLQATPGFFRGIPFDQALDQLEKAAKFDPTHAPALFDAYLAAAQAEKQRSFLSRDNRKMIDYYMGAFKALCKNGQYIIDCLQLCLDAKYHDDALTLYTEIQKQDWSQDLDLPADVLHRLGIKLADSQDTAAAFACLREAHSKEPDVKQYKQDYFQFVLDQAKKADPNRQTGKNEDDRIAELTETADRLRECWNEGFDSVPSLEEPFQKRLSQIYRTLAQAYQQKTLLPNHVDDCLSKQDIRDHLKACKSDIDQAMHFTEEGLTIDPENAIFHFEMGLLHEFWLQNFDEAFKKYELAVKYQSCNPFYHYFLGMLFFVTKSDGVKKDEHWALAEKYGYDSFLDDRRIFNNEMLYQDKTKAINPHEHTQKKSGWFG